MGQKPLMQPSPSASAQFWFERRPWNGRALWIALSATVISLDYLTGPYIMFPALFLPPVLLLAWNSGFGSSASLGLALCLVRLLLNDLWSETHSMTVSAVNSLLYSFVVVLIAFLTHAIARQTRGLREEVRQLEGILPICGFCKAIRDEHGEWQRLENYVSSRTEASFTHGLCPACTERHYGQFLQGSQGSA
jgi:hypothetical protein